MANQPYSNNLVSVVPNPAGDEHAPLLLVPDNPDPYIGLTLAQEREIANRAFDGANPIDARAFINARAVNTFGSFGHALFRAGIHFFLATIHYNLIGVIQASLEKNQYTHAHATVACFYVAIYVLAFTQGLAESFVRHDQLAQEWRRRRLLKAQVTSAVWQGQIRDLPDDSQLMRNWDVANEDGIGEVICGMTLMVFALQALDLGFCIAKIHEVFRHHNFSGDTKSQLNSALYFVPVVSASVSFLLATGFASTGRSMKAKTRRNTLIILTALALVAFCVGTGFDKVANHAPKANRNIVFN